MNVIKFELKKNMKSILIWSVVTSGILALFMSMFPTMESMDMMDVVMAKMDALPPAMLEMFNISTTMDFSNIIDYFAYSFQYILMAICIYGAILGTSALSKEEDEGTIEFLYSKPITRTSIVLKKLIVSVISLFILIMIIGIVSFGFVFAFTAGESNQIEILMKIKTILVGSFIVALIFMSVGFLISVLLKDNKSPIQIGLGMFFGTYVLGVVAKLNEDFEFLKYLSPYDKYTPSEIVASGFDFTYLVISAVVIVISLAVTFVLYKKRDFRV
ncbi:MAG: ABC transporter permease subunit [Sarcina sp.]